jgi:hypothetical protein
VDEGSAGANPVRKVTIASRHIIFGPDNAYLRDQSPRTACPAPDAFADDRIVGAVEVSLFYSPGRGRPRVVGRGYWPSLSGASIPNGLVACQSPTASMSAYEQETRKCTQIRSPTWSLDDPKPTSVACWFLFSTGLEAPSIIVPCAQECAVQVANAFASDYPTYFAAR